METEIPALWFGRCGPDGPADLGICGQRIERAAGVGGCPASELSQHLSERPAALRDRIFGRLFDVAEYARLDDEERKNYVESMNTARDTYNQIDYALNKGIGIGLEKKAYEIAQRMISKGLDVDTIADLTGLTKEEVAKLAEQ